MRYDQPLVRRLYPCYKLLLDPLRRSRLVARWLFGVRCPPDSHYFLWDLVTLGLRRVLAKEALAGVAMCDMGCGPVAALSVLAARGGCRDVTAVDIVPEFVESARAVLALSDVRAEVVLSSFDRDLGDRTFDLIVYNSAYIPEAWGEAQAINREYGIGTMPASVTWSGGTDGTENIREFLARVPGRLKSGGRILLGFNRFYVDPAGVARIARDGGLTVSRRHSWRVLPAVVTEIRR
jgi:methylase of polypeptide subunit release factors